MKRTITHFILCVLICCAFNALAQWGPAIPFPGTDRDGASGFSINGKGYIASGLFSSDTWEFDPAGNSWSPQANLNGNQTIIFAASIAVNNKGYMVCGDSAFGNSINAVREYDPAADAWTPKNNFPGGNRVGLAAWVANGRVFVGGGADNLSAGGVGPCHNDFYEYFPATDTWASLDTLPVKIAFASCFVINNECYFVFGNKSNAVYSNELWSYNPIANAWSQKSSCMGAGRSMGVGFAINGKGYAGIGQSFFTTHYTDFYEYNATADLWAPKASYPSGLSAGAAAFVINDTAYVGTGANLVSFNFNSNIYRFTSTSATGLNTIVGANTMSVYPNPATDVLTIDPLTVLPAGTKFSIYDMSGRMILSQFTGSVFQLDVKSMDAGLYLCVVNDGVQKRTVRFAIAK